MSTTLPLHFPDSPPAGKPEVPVTLCVSGQKLSETACVSTGNVYPVGSVGGWDEGLGRSLPSFPRGVFQGSCIPVQQGQRSHSGTEFSVEEAIPNEEFVFPK